jgi:predicted ATP-dependent endonuclease of OLD family
MALIDRVSIRGYRGVRDVTLEPRALAALAGESSSGKSTILTAIWTILEASAPVPAGNDVSHGHARVRLEADAGDKTLFLDARPPATLNVNRDGAPPSLYFPATLRSTTLIAAVSGRAQLAAGRAGIGSSRDGGLTLVHTIGALVESGARGLVLLIEEPELYLSPPAQRHLHRLLRRLAHRGRNQVLYSTHSPIFLGVDRLAELVLVRHDEKSGTRLVQPEELPNRSVFRVLAELDAERAELFLSRAVLLVEGRTEKLAMPFVFEALGFDADREAITVVDCAGKGNISLFAEICNACRIPYVVLHDRDAPRGRRPAQAEQIANEAILKVAGRRRTVMLVPDFEAVAGLPARRGKPEAAWRRFRKGDGDVPAPLADAVERVVTAARRAPRRL